MRMGVHLLIIPKPFIKRSVWVCGWHQNKSLLSYRVFLRYLKGCEDTRFLYSGFTGGAVDDCAFSFIYRHLRDRQGQRRMLSKRSLGQLEQRKTGFYYPVDKTDHFLLAVLVIALHNDMHQAV